MRTALVSLILLVWLGVAAAQDPSENQKPADGGDAKPADPAPAKAAAPKEAPAYKLPEKERNKLKGHLEKYLYPKKGKTRQQLREKFEQYVSKLVDGRVRVSCEDGKYTGDGVVAPQSASEAGQYIRRQ